MTYRQYLFWMIFATALSWFGVVSVIRMIDPMSSGFIGYLFFYLILSFALIGTLAMIGLIARSALKPHEAVAKHAATSFRQSILLSFLAIGTLMLHSMSILNWWTALLFIGTLTVAEFFLISYRS